MKRRDWKSWVYGAGFDTAEEVVSEVVKPAPWYLPYMPPIDFNFVTGNLVLGSAISTAADVEQLRAVGVTAVINCQIERDDRPLLGSKMASIWLGVDDDGKAKPVEWFQQGIDFARDEMAKPNGRVYVHCHAGINRAPSMAYAIRRAQGLSGDAAMLEMKLARPKVYALYRPDADRAIAALGLGAAA